MSRPSLLVSPLVLLALAAGPARAALWEPRPGVALTADDGVAQKLELFDLDADGFVDIVVACSSGGSVGDDSDAQLNRIFLNQGGEKFVELVGVFDEPDNAFVIKAGDIDGDGDGDLVVGVNFSGESYLLINDNGGLVRHDLFPGQSFSVGDLELGDVDGDGDLDILAADWGSSQPFGDPEDMGAPLRLWLNDGDGSFVDGAADLPLGMEALVSWSFDLELLDLDNDFDLDVVVASRGPGPAIALANDGAGVFDVLPIPALDGQGSKDLNVAFTPIDLDGDALIDLVTLQDGGDDCEVQNGGKVCGARNSVLLNELGAGLSDVTVNVWPAEHNPPGADLDAATLDLDNSGTPDLLVSGLRLGPVDNSTLLLTNSGAALSIAAVDPLGPDLDAGVGLMFADFDHDRREDVAVAVGDDAAPNLVLFGGTAPPDQVPEDMTPPIFETQELLPALLPHASQRRLRARVHDRKTPTRWHDFQHDPALDALNLADGAATAHRRRLPYLEFALGLADPFELEALPDTGPDKTIVPGVWYGESLWSFDVKLPVVDRDTTLTYRLCAIDAAGNKACVGPFQVDVDAGRPADCGDGVCEVPRESPGNCQLDCPCDQDGACEPPESGEFCCDCDGGCPGMTCGDGFCQQPNETPGNCPQDCQACDNDAICEPGEDPATCCDCSFCNDCGNGICEDPDETEANCPQDCGCVTGGCAPVCGDGLCEGEESPGTCPFDCIIDTAGDDDTGPATGGDDIVEPGCLCRDAPASGALGLLLLLARRRRASLS